MNQQPTQDRITYARQYAASVKERKASRHDCPHCQAKELEEVVIRITERWKQ